MEESRLVVATKMRKRTIRNMILFAVFGSLFVAVTPFGFLALGCIGILLWLCIIPLPADIKMCNKAIREESNIIPDGWELEINIPTSSGINRCVMINMSDGTKVEATGITRYEAIMNAIELIK